MIIDTKLLIHYIIILLFSKWKLHCEIQGLIQALPLGGPSGDILIIIFRLGDGDGRKEGSRHAYSPSNSGKTVEKPSVIHTRR